MIQLLTKVGCFDVDDMILNTLGAALGYGIYAVGTEASQKICRIYGNTVSGFMKDGILASGLAAGSRIEHNRVSTSAANGILVKCIDKSVVDGNYSFKNKARGILLQRCESAMVADNFVSENAINGIELNIRSNHSSVQGNVCGSNKNQVCELPDQRGFRQTEIPFAATEDMRR